MHETASYKNEVGSIVLLSSAFCLLNTNKQIHGSGRQMPRHLFKNLSKHKYIPVKVRYTENGDVRYI
jgi:hypothetical protein